MRPPWRAARRRHSHRASRCSTSASVSWIRVGLHPRLSRPFLVATDPESPPPGLGSSVVAIGNFDGVHRGHQAGIGHAKALADELGRPCAVLTFEPHPADVFAGRPTIFRLTPLPAKALALSRLGTVDGMFVRSFDRSFAAYRPRTSSGRFWSAGSE